MGAPPGGLGLRRRTLLGQAGTGPTLTFRSIALLPGRTHGAGAVRGESSLRGGARAGAHPRGGERVCGGGVGTAPVHVVWDLPCGGEVRAGDRNGGPPPRGRGENVREYHLVGARCETRAAAPEEKKTRGGLRRGGEFGGGGPPVGRGLGKGKGEKG